jgi:hypothetical protein
MPVAQKNISLDASLVLKLLLTPYLERPIMYKLSTADIGGNFFNFIHSMYSSVSYSIKLNGSYSPSFESNVGVLNKDVC